MCWPRLRCTCLIKSAILESKFSMVRRFVIRRFTFTTHVQSDRALPTCGASLYSVQSRFATVRFTTIQFYDPCPVGPSTPYLRCIAVFSMVSFCDGSLYDDSLLRPMSSRTEHSLLAVHHCIQYGLVLRRFVIRRFTLTTPVQSDQTLPTCGTTLSQLKRPFSTQCVLALFGVPVFLLYLFQCSSFKLIVIFPPMASNKKTEKKKKSKQLTSHSVLTSSEPAWAFFSKIKSD